MDLDKLKKEHEHYKLRLSCFIGTIHMITDLAKDANLIPFSEDDLYQLKEEARDLFGQSSRNTRMCIDIIDELEKILVEEEC